MGEFNEFDLDLSVNNTNINDSQVAAGTTSNPCWGVTTYITNSLVNGGCKTVNNPGCRCEKQSISTPCGSGGWLI